MLRQTAGYAHHAAAASLRRLSCTTTREVGFPAAEQSRRPQRKHTAGRTPVAPERRPALGLAKAGRNQVLHARRDVARDGQPLLVPPNRAHHLRRGRQGKEAGARQVACSACRCAVHSSRQPWTVRQGSGSRWSRSRRHPGQHQGQAANQALRSSRTRLHGGAVVPRFLIAHQLPKNHACTVRGQGAQHVCHTLLHDTAGVVEGNEAGGMAQQLLTGWPAA